MARAILALARHRQRGPKAGARVLAMAIVVGAVVSLPTNALAQRGPKPSSGAAARELPADVETAEQLYAKLDYDQANAVAERVVKRAALSHDQLVRAYRVLAVTYAILDKEDQARDAFFQLLLIDPDYQADPNLGPKVNTPFVEARGSFRSLPSTPGVEVAPSVSTSGGTLRITLRDPTRMVRKVNVGYRWTPSGPYALTQMTPSDSTSIEVLAAPPGRTRLDFWVQALDERENTVLETGSAQAPRTAFAERGERPGGGSGSSWQKSESGSIFSSPVFWVVTGALLAGGGTALFFVLRPDNPPTQATLSPVILCGTERCN